MELQQNLELIFDVDDVLRGQGADAAILRARRPALVQVAEKARQASLPLLQPKVIYRLYTVEAVRHEQLLLEGGKKIVSNFLVHQLAAAKQVIVLLATIGKELEDQVSKQWDADVVFALALDGAGSGAVEALANAACLYFEQEALNRGWQASIPFSPGMVDWSVADGQPQIFELLGEEASIVTLTPGCIMIPRKSLTLVMGIGENLDASGRACDFCSMQSTCRYQAHYRVKE